MKISILTRPNERGQIVIPKKVRDSLGIGPQTTLHVVQRGKGVCVYPVEELVHSGEEEHSSYLKVLETTKGKWSSEKWGEVRKKRRATEIEASQKRKKAW